MKPSEVVLEGTAEVIDDDGQVLEVTKRRSPRQRGWELVRDVVIPVALGAGVTGLVALAWKRR